MVSILIPIYNEVILDLTKALLNQAVRLDIPFEILLYDDASNEVFKKQNRRVVEWAPEIRYRELPKNLGRSAIRNLLFEEAQYDFCIVLDCDSELLGEDFLNNYLRFRSNGVIYGGRSYRKDSPDNPSHFLRWKYGKEREQVDLETRKKQPYRYFLTNNFALNKRVLEKVKFNTEISGYGHEDTLFSRDLERQNIVVEHIDNPVNHIGLETSDLFLKKTQNALTNLLKLYESGQIRSTSFPLLTAFEKLKNWRLLKVWLFIGSVFLPKWEKNLNSKKPKLINFDLYRLYWLCKLASTSR